MTLLLALHLTISIARAPTDVYRYAVNAQNLPTWAAGLAGSKIQREGDHWISESGLGRVKIKFAAPNDMGVMDHDVTLPSGSITHNAFRVIPNGLGSEVIFSLFRDGKMSEEQFNKDAAQIRRDLQTLKEVLERK